MLNSIHSYSRFQRFLLFMCCLGLFSGYATAQVEAALAQANQHMVAKKYEEAARVYEGLLAEGYTGAELHYNLGNAWYRSGDLGKAVLNYERALRLDPGDAATRANLELVKEQLSDEIIELEPFFLYRWWQNLLNVFPATIWALLSILLLWGALFFGFRYLYGQERAQRKTAFIRSISLALLGLLLVFLAARQYDSEQDSQAAVILANEAPLCSAPNDPTTAVQTLHAGTKVFLLDQIGEWQLVRLVNGDRGWMNQSVLEKI